MTAVERERLKEMVGCYRSAPDLQSGAAAWRAIHRFVDGLEKRAATKAVSSAVATPLFQVTPEAQEAVHEMRRALTALLLEIPESIVADVTRRFDAVLDTVAGPDRFQRLPGAAATPHPGGGK